MAGFNQIPVQTTFYLPDMVNGIVASIQTGGLPAFRTGYWNELKQINQGIGRVNGTKYPIVYLHLDYDFNYENSSPSFGCNFTIWFITSSNKEYSATDRLDNVVKVTLEPIYNNFMAKLKANKWLVSDRVIGHNKRYLFYDLHQKEEQNPLNEVIEAIRISFNNLQFKNLSNL